MWKEVFVKEFQEYNSKDLSIYLSPPPPPTPSSLCLSTAEPAPQGTMLSLNPKPQPPPDRSPLLPHHPFHPPLHNEMPPQ